MKGLFEQHIQVTEKVLDLRLERQNLVMGNITNVNTPGYKARRLEFEKQLQGALNLDATGKMTRTKGDHMPSVFNANTFQGKGLKDFEPRYVYGEDTVDLDTEMGVMAKNSMLYNALTDVIKKNFTGIQKVITEAKA